LTCAAATVAVAAAMPASASPQRYYLALGDSVAYGIQPDKVDAALPPSGFDTGYVDVFAARLRTLVPAIRVVNYGCPGESTKTFVGGGCIWTAGGRLLHNSFRGAQLDAALAFLRAHRGQVSPITLTLGASAELHTFDSCHLDFACIRARAPRAITTYASRMGQILRRVRSVAPAADMIVTGSWNTDLAHLRQSDPLVKSANAALARVVARARGRFADVFPVFNPVGSVAHEKARLCAYTFLCSGNDGHPTNAGYRAVATVVWKASGYKS